MRLFAISDLHVGHAQNRAALAALTARPDDWLILAGDLGETDEHVRHVLEVAGQKFRQLIWVPGNHELYVMPGSHGEPRGQDRYLHLVALCRSLGVITPEDPYPLWSGDGGPHVIAPLFLLYDYSFRPDHITEDQAVDWAAESDIVCTDEYLLDPHPYPRRQDWCSARITATEARLSAAASEHPTVLINHFPLREELVRLRRIPRFSIWCGTRRTHDWHQRFRARVVVSGHLHIPRTDWIDGVRFEEVSFGYPSQRALGPGMDRYLRQILPEPRSP
jgi:3',5'-cyclic AMP phosphodiesterase CpdA